ncbi:MAG TPA: cytochrome c biogenesis CcdA family protein [Acidimicrobiia bacterium]|nr:cytochrome c biogenesis CcdA family protein [Acidimicrobiia bacterium]
MEGIFFGTSLLAAFIAGSVALFAPCCIVFMFPAYLAAAVRNRRWRLVPFTLVFAAGLALVLVPVTLGVGLLTRPLLRYHAFIYTAGGLLMLAMAWFAATGKNWSLPMLKGSPDLQRTDSAGVFALGVFSGAASSCCAPVLAGVVAMSAVAPSLPSAVFIGLAYVFGMVFPLLVMTLVWDRSGLRQSRRIRGRDIRWSLFGRKFRTNTINLVAAVVMGAMGLGFILLAVTGASLVSEAQTGAAAWIEDRLKPVVDLLAPIPDWLGALFLVAIAVGAVAISGRKRPQAKHEEGSSDDNEDQAEQPAGRTLGVG